VVIKDGDSTYTPGRPASDGPQLKFKFVTTASFFVVAINQKRSVTLAQLDGSLQVPAGKVTIPPKTTPSPRSIGALGRV
jgi:bifunctional non-homologous end joining protein LigD